MDNIQEQMNTVLNNPEMMQKIMGLAQSLGQTQSAQNTSVPHENADIPFPEIDISMLQKLSKLAGGSKIDKNQQSLLSALRPYLSNDRINKLEKAMRAAKLANIASGLLGSSGFQFNAGR